MNQQQNLAVSGAELMNSFDCILRTMLCGDLKNHGRNTDQWDDNGKGKNHLRAVRHDAGNDDVDWNDAPLQRA